MFDNTNLRQDFVFEKWCPKKTLFIEILGEQTQIVALKATGFQNWAESCEKKILTNKSSQASIARKEMHFLSTK